jgi:hypothetical protein
MIEHKPSNKSQMQNLLTTCHFPSCHPSLHQQPLCIAIKLRRDLREDMLTIIELYDFLNSPLYIMAVPFYIMGCYPNWYQHKMSHYI